MATSISAPANIKALRTQDQKSIILVWDTVGVTDTVYDIDISVLSPELGFTAVVTGQAEITTTAQQAYVITGLRDDRAYYIRLRARSGTASSIYTTVYSGL